MYASASDYFCNLCSILAVDNGLCDCNLSSKQMIGDEHTCSLIYFVSLLPTPKSLFLPGVCFSLSACLQQLHVNTTDRIFMKILSEMHLSDKGSAH